MGPIDQNVQNYLNEFLLKLLKEKKAFAFLQGDDVDRFKAYLSIRNDLERSQFAVRKLIEMRDKIEIKQPRTVDFENSVPNYSIYLAAINFYVKCFLSIGAKRQGKNKTKPRSLNLDKDIFKERPILEKTHETAVDIRNSFLSHGGTSDHEVIIPLLVFHNNSSEVNFDLFVKQVSVDYDFLEPLHENIKFSIDYTMTKLADYKKIMQKNICDDKALYDKYRAEAVSNISKYWK